MTFWKILSMQEDKEAVCHESWAPWTQLTTGKAQVEYSIWLIQFQGSGAVHAHSLMSHR